MVTPSIRRFDLGSASQPIFQFIVATVPLFFLLLWFVYDAHEQMKTSCYNDDQEFYDEQSFAAYEEECGKLIPLSQFVYVFLVIYFCCILLEIYILVFIPRRHALINEYLCHGETKIGNVYYKPHKKAMALTLTSHGHVVYEHDSKRIRRKVQIFERYSRELAAILVLPNLPMSGQPKVDLEIDRDSFEMNKPRMKILTWYVGVWSFFCAVAPAYIARNLDIIRSRNGTESGGSRFLVVIIMAFCVIPTVASIWIYTVWISYKRWMTLQHKVLEEDELADEPQSGCCFDDQDCEAVQMTDYVHMQSSESGNGKKLGF